jgi:hypothetical protein
MAILNFFKKQPPVLFRCSHCQDEKTLTQRQLRLVAKIGLKHPLCPFLIPCPACKTGFFAPVDYTDADGNRFVLDQLKKRIFIDQSTHTTHSFEFED